MAAEDGLPANFLIFRQHSEGLYFARDGNYEFIKIIQAIYMQSLSTDVLILFNSSEPVKLVEKVILNSEKVQSAFRVSCFMHSDLFHTDLNLVTDKCPIAYLFRFLIQGFIRVYSKDIYQYRLSNVLRSKSGASGIRTALLTLTAESEKLQSSKTASQKNNTVAQNKKLSSAIDPLAFYSCKCGKGYKENREGYYLRHVATCSKSSTTSNSVSNCSVKEAMILDNLIDLECFEELGEFDWDLDR